MHLSTPDNTPTWDSMPVENHCFALHWSLTCSSVHVQKMFQGLGGCMSGDAFYIHWETKKTKQNWSSSFPEAFWDLGGLVTWKLHHALTTRFVHLRVSASTGVPRTKTPWMLRLYIFWFLLFEGIERKTIFMHARISVVANSWSSALISIPPAYRISVRVDWIKLCWLLNAVID